MWISFFINELRQISGKKAEFHILTLIVSGKKTFSLLWSWMINLCARRILRQMKILRKKMIWRGLTMENMWIKFKGK